MQENLRKNYDLAIKRKENWYEEQVGKLGRAHLKEEEVLRTQHRRELIEEQEKVSRLVKEIARVRLEFGPGRYGTRWQMTVTFDDNFMTGANDLKQIGPYVIQRLCRQIEREFAQIDFGRAKPVMPSYEERNEPIRYRLET